MSSAVYSVDTPSPKDGVEEFDQNLERTKLEEKEELHVESHDDKEVPKSTAYFDSQVFSEKDDQQLEATRNQGQTQNESVELDKKEKSLFCKDPTNPISVTEKWNLSKNDFYSSKAQEYRQVGPSLVSDSKKEIESGGESSEGQQDLKYRMEPSLSSTMLPPDISAFQSTSSLIYNKECGINQGYYCNPHSSFVGISSWASHIPGNVAVSNSMLNMEHYREMGQPNSYYYSGEHTIIDEEARSASLVLLKLKSVAGEDLLEISPLRRKRWKRESGEYGGRNENSLKDMNYAHRRDADYDSRDGKESNKMLKRTKRSLDAGSILPHTEVACKVNDEDSNECSWILGTVYRYLSDSGEYQVIDAAELDNDDESSERYYLVSSENVIALSKDTKNVFPPSTRVLAIYPDTTVFYPATIRSSRKNGKQLIYALEFDDEDEEEELVKHVPARYVILNPE